MKRRSVFKILCGAVVGGLTAPYLATAAEPIVVVDPASPWYAARQLAKFKPPAPPIYHDYPMEGGLYKAGETCKITGRPFEVPIEYKPGDTFEIIGPGGRGTAPLQQVNIIE